MSGFPSLSAAGERRQARLVDARIQVVVGTRNQRGDLETFLTALCGASVDVCRLRDDTATEDELRAAADVFRRVCDRAGALFVMDRLPGLALQVSADGVQVGPGDVPSDHARRVVGPDLLVGLLVTTPAQIEQSADEDVDALVVGPPPTALTPSLETVRHAARRAPRPWFVAGFRPDGLAPLLAAGARRVVIDHGLESADPARICWAVRRTLAAYQLT